MINKIIGLGLAMALSFSTFAQEGQWVQVFYEDFGGNDASDPLVGSALSSDVISSDFIFDSESYGGDYCVLKRTDHSDWHTGGDHTNASNSNLGYFMQVNPNASNRTVRVYCCKLTGICPGVTFRFSVWLANMTLVSAEGTLPHLSVGIYNDIDATNLVSSSAYKDLTLPKCTGANANSFDWEKLEIEFEMNGNQNYAYFIVGVEAPEANGFDFAVDDISIEVQHPTFSISNLNDYEYGQPVTLAADFVNDGYFANMSDVIYKWYYSKDGVNFPTAIYEGRYTQNNNFAYTIPAFDKDEHNGYYRLRIGERGNFDSDVCSITADFQIDEKLNKQNVTLCKNEVRQIGGTSLNASLLSDGDEVTSSDNPNMVYVVSIVKPKVIKVGEDYICINSEYNGKTYTKDGTYYLNDTITAKATGCDSIYNQTVLYVTNQEIRFKTDTSICQGVKYNGKTYDKVGVIPDTTDNGCVQFVQKIKVNPVYSQSLNYTICSGSLVNGEVFPTGGNYTRTLYLKTTEGCDSTISANIDVTDKIIVDLPSVELCEGETYDFDGKTYSTPGTYNLTANSVSVVTGCDSITNVKLTIYPTASNINHPTDTVICFGSPLFGTIYETPTTTPILVKEPHTYTSVHGCDSFAYYNLTVLQMELRLHVKQDRNVICRGEEVEIDVATLRPADALLAWSHIFSGSNMKAIFTPEHDMTYVVLARNQEAGCEASDTVKVSVRDSPVLTIDSVDQKENRVEYHVEGGTLPYTVIRDKSKLENDAFGEILNSSIGMHRLTVRDSSLCESSQIYEITPIPITPSGIFTPNGDGVNDKWTIENIDVYARARVRIYDRTGRVLAEYSGYDNNQGWDGTYLGHLLPPTDYWYEINLPEVDKQYIGHFTLFYDMK